MYINIENNVMLVGNEEDLIINDKEILYWKSVKKYLEDNNLITVLKINPNDAIKFNSDLFSFLNSLDISSEYHIPLMLINGFNSPKDFKYNTTSLIIVESNELDDLKNNLRI